VLKATNTPLLALPATIGGCVSLEVLRVDGTKLSELPPNVTECRNLLVPQRLYDRRWRWWHS
jgi:hypothetical protein